MTKEEIEKWEFVKYKMDDEGLDYCFMHYSSFDEIEDEEFHELRKNYLESAKLLKRYVNNKNE